MRRRCRHRAADAVLRTRRAVSRGGDVGHAEFPKEAERKRAEEADAARRRAEEVAERKRAEEAEAARKLAKEKEERKRAEADEARRKAEEEERQRAEAEAKGAEDNAAACRRTDEESQREPFSCRRHPRLLRPEWREIAVRSPVPTCFAEIPEQACELRQDAH